VACLAWKAESSVCASSRSRFEAASARFKALICSLSTTNAQCGAVLSESDEGSRTGESVFRLVREEVREISAAAAG
jgi:hypothetical protein